MEPVGVQEFSFRIAGVIGHPGVDVYKVQVVGLSVYFFLDDLICIADAVDDVPTGDAGLYGNEGEGDVTKLAAGAGNELLKKDEYLFGVAAVAEIVVAGVYDDPFRVEGSDESIEEPVTGGEGGSAETEVNGLVAGEVLVQTFPKPDGGTAVEEQFWLVGKCCSLLFQPLHFVFVPDHKRGLLIKDRSSAPEPFLPVNW